MQLVRFAVAAVIAAGALMFPEDVLNAARRAMLVWYASVAPSLFPFMALMPLLTSPYAARVYARLAGPVMRPLFGLPGEAAPAVVIGVAAGSPAGAHAALRIARSAGLNRGQLTRLVCCATGLSPAFLITGIGAAMLGDAEAGLVLLKAQLSVQFLLLFATRFCREDARPVEAADVLTGDDPMRTAVASVLSVGGWMVMFSVAAAIVGRFVPKSAAAALLCVLDLPSGAHALAELPVEREIKVLMLAAAVGFGGFCVGMQNVSAVRGWVKMKDYLAAKAASAVLMPVAAAMVLRFPEGKIRKTEDFLPEQALAAVIFCVPVLIFLWKNLFLNKRKSEKMDVF